MIDLKEILKAFPTGFVLYDSDFRVVEISDFVLGHISISKEQAIGMKFTDFIHVDEVEDVNVKLSSFSNSDQDFYELDFRARSKDSKYHYVRSKLSKVDWGEIRYLSVGIPFSDLRVKNLSLLAEIEKYKKLEYLAKIGLWELDIGKNDLYWSDETYHIHKVPKGSSLDVDEAINFYHPEDRERITELVENCIAHGTAYDERLRIINREGQIVWVEVRGQAFFDSGGKIIKMYGTFQDISKQVELETQNKKNQSIANSYRSMMDEFAIVAKTDIDGNITYANNQFCKISGYSRSELMGQNHRILSSGEHSKEFWEDMWGKIKSAKTWRSEVCNRAKDGGLYWVDTFISPILSDDQKIMGYMAIRVDISEQKNNEINLSMEREKATIASQLATVGEMSAGIAHEVNNPLAVISGNVDMISMKIDKGKTENLSKNIETIKKSINRILKIIKGLKRVSYKSESNELERVSMHEIMSDTLDFSFEMLRSKGIELNIEDLPDCQVCCRSVEISQVLLNLVNNAKDAIADLPTKWIKVQTFQVKDKLRINVIDSGTGIPTELREKIMESFFTTKGLGEGTGLGLSLSKRIIEEHQGEFFIDTDSENTCFSIILPIAK